MDGDGHNSDTLGFGLPQFGHDGHNLATWSASGPGSLDRVMSLILKGNSEQFPLLVYLVMSVGARVGIAIFLHDREE